MKLYHPKLNPFPNHLEDFFHSFRNIYVLYRYALKILNSTFLLLRNPNIKMLFALKAGLLDILETYFR
jgi:hypothetical protein